MNKGNISVHSPANDLTSGFNVGGKSGPGAPSVHPDVNVSGESMSGKAVGHDFGSTDGRTPVSVEEVQMATGIPTSYSEAGLGGTLIGGLGNPPKP
jgi:hypothetical protein